MKQRQKMTATVLAAHRVGITGDVRYGLVVKQGRDVVRVATVEVQRRLTATDEPRSDEQMTEYAKEAAEYISIHRPGVKVLSAVYDGGKLTGL